MITTRLCPPSCSRTIWTRLLSKMRLCVKITSADDAWTSPLLLAMLLSPHCLLAHFVASLVIPKMSAGSMLVQRTSYTRIVPTTKARSPTTTATTLRLRTLPLYPKSPSLQEMRVLPLHPNHNWLADTGATSHMTPHHHWVQNYSPLCMPIRLADNSVIYSSGVGTVVFNPVIGGKASQPVEFSRVLHVPSLQNNLLSCLYLTKHKNINIHIDSVQMEFM